MLQEFWDCTYNFSARNPQGEIVDHWALKNALVNEGAEVAIETLLRNNAAAYIPDGNFYVGLYLGSMSRTTTISTIPGEPIGNNYFRQPLVRTASGWPVKEIDTDGFWIIGSVEVQFEAIGGDIGPFFGAFLATSSDSSGRLISYVTDQLRRTIVDGSSITVALKVRCR
jgi:hypothetical protein